MYQSLTARGHDPIISDFVILMLVFTRYSRKYSRSAGNANKLPSSAAMPIAVESGNNADSRPARARCARSVDCHRGGVIPQERLRPDDGQGSMAMKATDAHEDKWFSTAVVTIPQRSGARSLKLKSARSNGSDLEQHRP